MAWDDIPDWSLDVAEHLLSSLKEKDPFTFYHCCRVGRGARKLAKAMGLNEFEQAILEYSGLFHDIGKLNIPLEILSKPGRLEREEIEIIKTHPEQSFEMIKGFGHSAFFRFMFPGVRYHHEKLDGTGYPGNIQGESIPLFARVIAVVDSFDAMTNTRPYRNPLSEDKVIRELKDFSGTQFDGNIVKIFLEILETVKQVEADPADELVVKRLIKAA